MNHSYTVDVQWKEGRIGELSSPDLNTKIACATPPEFPKGVPNIWSPEHLYAAAINSCYMASFLAIAENLKINFLDFNCQTTVELGRVDKGIQIIQAEIKPKVKLANSGDFDKMKHVIDKAKKICLVTNSIKTKASLKPIIH